MQNFNYVIHAQVYFTPAFFTDSVECSIFAWTIHKVLCLFTDFSFSLKTSPQSKYNDDH